MRIVEVNYTDLPGRVYNGYDLHRSLKAQGYIAHQIVLDKRSGTDSVRALKNDVILNEQIRHIEKKYSMSNILMPYGQWLMHREEFLKADVVHYHILHCWMISLLDYPALMNAKASVWTLHDPWIFTGNCGHPLDCPKWKTGCAACDRLDEKWFEMHDNNTDKMWQIKKAVFAQINPRIIVSSQFMKRYVQESPLTSHWEHIDVIPFGVKRTYLEFFDSSEVRRRHKVPFNGFVIGFRCDYRQVKGCGLIFEALRSVHELEDLYIITVGGMPLPEDLADKVHYVDWGWIDDDEKMKDFYNLCDVFLMPSLAESFGMMALEAMASRAVCICFRTTVVEEIVKGSEGGISVEYASSQELMNAILYLYQNREECGARGEKGREFVEKNYPFESYVNRHLEVYNQMYNQSEG